VFIFPSISYCFDHLRPRPPYLDTKMQRQTLLFPLL